MRSRHLASIVLAATVSSSVAAAGQANRITEYPVGVVPYGIATNPDGSAVYYTNGSSFWALFPSDGSTGALDASGATNLKTIAAGADTFWIAEPSGNRIWSHPFRTGAFTGLTSPTVSSQPSGIAVGPDGNVWYSEVIGNKIVRVTPFEITEFPLPHASSQPNGIARGFDGNVWFAETSGNRLAKISPAGTITEYDLPTPGSSPVSVASSMRYVAATEPGTNQIAVFDRFSASVHEYAVPTPGAWPQQIVWGADGAFWFTEFFGNKIGRFDPLTDGFEEFPIPTAASQPRALTLLPNGDLAFAEEAAHKIGLFHLRLPGDVDHDDDVDAGDVFYLINYLYAAGPAPQ
jgi:virginiamycin B lyase